MKTKIVEYRLDIAVLYRWIRTFVPQIPALIAAIIPVVSTMDVPGWVVPTLVALGTIATAIDKFAREIGFYNDVKSYVDEKVDALIKI